MKQHGEACPHTPQVLDTIVKYYSNDKPNVYIKDQVIRRRGRRERRLTGRF